MFRITMATFCYLVDGLDGRKAIRPIPWAFAPEGIGHIRGVRFVAEVEADAELCPGIVPMQLKVIDPEGREIADTEMLEYDIDVAPDGSYGMVAAEIDLSGHLLSEHGTYEGHVNLDDEFLHITKFGIFRTNIAKG